MNTNIEADTSILAGLTFDRSNRRYRPGRGFEATTYTFEDGTFSGTHSEMRDNGEAATGTMSLGS